MERIYLFTFFILLSLFSSSQVTSIEYNTGVNRLPETRSIISRLKQNIPQLLQKADVPGMSIALIRQGQLVWTGAFGTANADTKKAVTGNTVFEAASLSKPVFAYGVLKLADEGKLDLDTPLNKYLGNNYDVTGDDRINLITA